MSRPTVLFALATLLSLGFSTRSPAGSISGVIRDPSGAPFPGVRITLLSAATRARRTANSDASGAFQFSQLEPAAWSLSAEATGFKRAEIHSVIVQVDQETHVDLMMQLGAMSEVVDVTAADRAFAHDTSVVIDRRTIDSLPLNARQFLDLALMTPGTVPAAPGTQAGGFNAAGARSQSNVYLLDGVSNLDTQQNGPLNAFRITDAVQEFAVHTSVPLPEFGRGSGAQVNIVTKSGSNEFHGAAFEYFRDTNLDAADFFTNKLGGQKSVLNRNQFGVSSGGRLVKDRTFFFASYEGFRQLAPTVRATRVPTLAERASVTDSISRRLLDYWPLPNADGTSNFIANVRNEDDDDTGFIRVDHRLGPSDQLSGRWTEYRGSSFSGGPTPLTGGNQGEPVQRSVMFSAARMFSPAFSSDLRFGYSRNVNERTLQDDGLNAATIFTDAGGAPLPGVVDAAKDRLNSGLPSVSVGGGFAALGANVNLPQGRISSTFEVSENMSLEAPFGWSRHSWRWGFHIRREDLRRYLDRASRGAFNFSSFADFARGLVNTSSFRSGSTLAYWRRYPWDAFWQDEVRVRDDLTLNYGVRYEYPSAVEETNGHATNFVPGYGPMVAGSNRILDIDPALTGPSSLVFRTAPFTLPASGVYSDKNNLAPMAGFAYTPRVGGFLFGEHDVVIRGGFRVAYDDLFNNVPSSMALSPPYNLQTTQTANVTQPARFPWAVGFDQNVRLISNVGRQGPGTPAVGVLNFQGVDPHLRSAYLYQYHLGIERRLGDRLSIEADYHGSAGRALGIFIDVNQPTVIVRDPSRRGTVAPNEQVFPYDHFGNVQLAESIGRSSYNGLVLIGTYRDRGGLFVQGSYTLGRSLDDNSSYFGSGNLLGETGAPVDSRNLQLEYGPSAFDVRHRFHLLYVVPLPVGPGHRLFGWNTGVARWMFEGWQVSGVATLQSGYPFTVVSGGADSSGFNQASSGVSPAGGDRPDVIKPGPLPQDNRNPDAAFDRTWFTAAFAGRVGTSGRNQYYGPGLQNVDLAVAKDFAIGARSGNQPRVGFRADFFNLFNRPTFANPVSDLSNASFGRITQTLGSATAMSVGTTSGPIGGPRVIQLSLRIRF